MYTCSPVWIFETLFSMKIYTIKKIYYVYVTFIMFTCWVCFVKFKYCHNKYISDLFCLTFVKKQHQTIFKVFGTLKKNKLFGCVFYLCACEVLE